MLNGRKRSILVADFETTTKADDCRVWGWGCCLVENYHRVDIGTDLESFLNYISQGNSITYFHNLRFDGTFILDYLLKNGYEHNTDKPDAKEFSTLIDKTGKYYSITVNWGRYKTEFRDSWKRIPMGVKAMAKAYELDIEKGEIDYHAERPIGHVITPEERKYIKNDVQIVAQAIKVQQDEGMTKLTVGSDALAEYKRTIGTRDFNRYFPVLSMELDAEIRKAYRGGFTYCAPRYQGKVTGPGKVYDVNSLYPFVMYSSLLPIQEPLFTDGAPEEIEDYPLWITSITFTAKLKKNHIPCIQVKNSPHFANTVYQESINDPVTLYCTNVDFELWNEQYDLDIITFNGTWYFQGMRDLFKEYIDKWSEIKANSTGGKRDVAKLHLNSLYGKYASNPEITPKYPVLENNRVKLETGPDEMRSPVYTAMGVFITAYARNITIRAAQANYATFAYCDTDSLHLITDKHPTNITIAKNALGAWDHEMDFEAALFIRAKCYSERTYDGEYHNRVAGLPVQESAKLTFESFKVGEGIGTRLKPKNVPGGQILISELYTLKM